MNSAKTTEISVPQLFHGTSTLFLESILEHGLGARNPIKDLELIEFAAEILPLVEKHLATHDDYKLKVSSFRRMVEQKAGPMNFQHGDTYLSPAPMTAARYAISKRHGSELLSYAIDFLERLLRAQVAGVRDRLYRQYPRIFEKLDVSPAPLLIGVTGVLPSDLFREDGSDPIPVLKRLNRAGLEPAKLNGSALQQANFRLRNPIPPQNLSVWLINVTRWDPAQPRFTIYPVSPEGEAGG